MQNTRTRIQSFRVFRVFRGPLPIRKLPVNPYMIEQLSLNESCHLPKIHAFFVAVEGIKSLDLALGFILG